ncbi:MAG: hypothetical protein WCJ30_25170 [Deltaproteobacteria bacterium]
MTLLALGCFDLLRGVMHTVFVDLAIRTFAHLDLSCRPDDQKMLLMAFGISNLLTGALFVLISMKARAIVRFVLPLIPVCYLFGGIVVKTTLHPQSAFMGRWFMLVYLVVCVLASIAIQLSERRTRRS